MDLNDFQPLPPPQPAIVALTPKQREFVEWETTPIDLRPDGQMHLHQWAAKNRTDPASCMRWRKDPTIVMAIRATALEKGLVDHKVRTVLDAAYSAAVNKNDVRAAKLFLDYYGANSVQIAVEDEGKPEPAVPAPKTLAEMTTEELEAEFAKLDPQ